MTEVIADRVEFIERKEKSAQKAESEAMEGFGSEVQFDEEIPF